MPITRPQHIRERALGDRRDIFSSSQSADTTNPAVAGPSRAEAAQQVRDTLRTPGWRVIREALVAKNMLLWKQLTDPSLDPVRAQVVRAQAIKYSGIEDLIDEILKLGEREQQGEAQL